jgi:dynein heavy chain, axonemal
VKAERLIEMAKTQGEWILL